LYYRAVYTPPCTAIKEAEATYCINFINDYTSENNHKLIYIHFKSRAKIHSRIGSTKVIVDTSHGSNDSTLKLN